MSISVAAVQLKAEPGQAAGNRDLLLARIEEAAAAGARIVVLPELAVSGYTFDAKALADAKEPLDGPTLASWTDAARRLGIVIAGGFCEEQEGRLFNSAILVGPDGLLSHYRKLHLFDREKLVFTPGDLPLSVAATPFGRVGMCVCYDLRFVEVMRLLALLDAELVAVPTCWVGGFDKAARDGDGLIGQARGAIVQANLNQVYIACASQCGTAQDMVFLGSSLVADPYGRMLAGAMGEDETGMVLAEFDPLMVAAAQERTELVKPRLDRRTDLYGVTQGEQRF